MANPASTFRIDLQPLGRRIGLTAGQTLLEAAQASGLELVAVCGGNGSCGTCRVRVVSGQLSALTSIEAHELEEAEISTGYRLACQALPINKIDAFSLHQVPTSNMLRELQDQCGVKVTVIACDVGLISQEMKAELSPSTQQAVLTACQQIAGRFLLPP